MTLTEKYTLSEEPLLTEEYAPRDAFEPVVARCRLRRHRMRTSFCLWFSVDCWQVISGSGMGLRHSSCIANLSFAHHVEFGVTGVMPIIFCLSARVVPCAFG